MASSAFLRKLEWLSRKAVKAAPNGDMRRSHHARVRATVSEDPATGTRHRRHHIASDGYYRGRQVLEVKQPKQESDEADT